MPRLITIDPGYGKRTRGCALAGFDDRDRLESIWFMRRTDTPLAGLVDVATIVVERPQQDGRTYAIPPATLEALAWEGAAVAYVLAGATGARVVELTPTQWKKGSRKPCQHARLWDALDLEERRTIGGIRVGRIIDAATEAGARDRWRKKDSASYYSPSAKALTDTLDAVALGCVYLGRMK